MNNKYIILLLLLFVWASCDTIDENEFPEILSANAEVLSFKTGNNFSLEVDTVNNKIFGILPPYTNIQNLTPEIEISRGATIEPASGTVLDFSNRVNYTVVARNGVSTSNYEANIYSFGIASFTIEGNAIPIDYQEKKISENFLLSENPFTDITNLSPVIELTSGCTVSPASGEAVDLSEPVTYTVTNSKGIESEYVVSIKLIEDREVFDDFETDWTTTNNGELWDASGSTLVFTSKGGGWDQRAIMNNVELTGDFMVEVKVKITQRMAAYWPRVGFFIGGTFGNPMNQPKFLFALDANDINGTPHYDIVSLHSFFSPWYAVNYQINGLDVRDWTILKMEKRGDEIKAYVNDELISTETISGIEGNLGLFGENAHGEFEFVSFKEL